MLWRDFSVAACDINRLEESFDGDVIEGYQLESRAERFLSRCLLAIQNFIECPWLNGIATLFQALNIQLRNMEIDDVPEFKDHIATTCSQGGFIANVSIVSIKEHCRVGDGSLLREPTLYSDYLHY